MVRDVVVCGSSDAVLESGLDASRLAFVAPLGSRSELEAVLRQVLGQPDVRHLVLRRPEVCEVHVRSVAVDTERFGRQIDIDGARNGVCNNKWR